MKNTENGGVVLITGGSSGIGAATVRTLSGAGFTVYAASRSGRLPEGCQAGRTLKPLVMDVNDEVAVRSGVERIVSEQGRIDAVVCNAGNGIAGPIEETSVAEMQAQFETTFFGVARTIRACAPFFRVQGSGRVITVSSVAAVAPLPFQGFYSAAKAGILQLTKALSIEMRSFGVQCCCILPGDVKTGFTAARRVVAAAQDPASPYREMTARSLIQMEKDEQREGMPPSVIASAVLRQLRRKKMRPECVPGALYAFLVPVIRLLPERLVLRVIEKMYL